MDLNSFNSEISSSLWDEAHQYIVNKAGTAPNLEPLVRKLPLNKQCDLAQVLHNLLLVAFCAEHTSRVKRTFDVLEPLYQNPEIVKAFIQTPPSAFRWGNWIFQVHQRQKTHKVLPPIAEPGVGAFLLTYAECFPNLLKGTLNAMAEEDGVPLQWGRHFGLPAYIDRWNEKYLGEKIPDLGQKIEQWNIRVQRDVLLQEANESHLNTPSTSVRARKM